MFQVESRAQMSCLPRMQPNEFYDIVVQVAIIRPGPIVGKMVHPYLKRRQGREAVDYLHPSLEPVLKRTLGVPLFQEQLLRMAMIVADSPAARRKNCAAPWASSARRSACARSKRKLRAGMTAQRHHRRGAGAHRAVDHFVRAVRISRIARRQLRADRLCQRVSEVPLPGRVHCALLNNQPMGFYHPAVLVKDAQRHGLRVLPVDVNVSEWKCTIEGEEHACAGSALYSRSWRGNGKVIAESKPFRDVDDLARRVPQLHKDELEKLAGAGALAKLETAHRRDDFGKRAAQAVRRVLCWRMCRKILPKSLYRA